MASLLLGLPNSNGAFQKNFSAPELRIRLRSPIHVVVAERGASSKGSDSRRHRGLPRRSQSRKNQCWSCEYLFCLWSNLTLPSESWALSFWKYCILLDHHFCCIFLLPLDEVAIQYRVEVFSFILIMFFFSLLVLEIE